MLLFFSSEVFLLNRSFLQSTMLINLLWLLLRHRSLLDDCRARLCHLFFWLSDCKRSRPKGRIVVRRIVFRIVSWKAAARNSERAVKRPKRDAHRDSSCYPTKDRDEFMMSGTTFRTRRRSFFFLCATCARATQPDRGFIPLCRSRDRRRLPCTTLRKYAFFRVCRVGGLSFEATIKWKASPATHHCRRLIELEPNCASRARRPTKLPFESFGIYSTPRARLHSLIINLHRGVVE